ncbi:MAG: hypothetical protein EZS28_009661 [Streblomastix strix]|uniref:Uncharacterized protein n=1 Tax=Streblomastix strix TaxID=222440 RepID=A0A5J4WIQ7_9EUKA|nr:MAG: hypothetical protein EZS28_009661 [Streblomastix strix]
MNVHYDLSKEDIIRDFIFSFLSDLKKKMKIIALIRMKMDLPLIIDNLIVCVEYPYNILGAGEDVTSILGNGGRGGSEDDQVFVIGIYSVDGIGYLQKAHEMMLSLEEVEVSALGCGGKGIEDVNVF